MKTQVIFLALIFSALAAFTQCQPTATNPAFLVSTETLDDWQELGFCFSTSCTNDPAWSQVVAFRNLDPVLNGPLSFVIQSPEAVFFTVTSTQCDTVFDARCIAGVDTFSILNAGGNFNLILQSESQEPVTLHGFVGGQVITTPPQACNVTSTPDPIPQKYTYQAFEAAKGTLGKPTTNIPKGLSLRSDGAKVLNR